MTDKKKDKKIRKIPINHDGPPRDSEKDKPDVDEPVDPGASQHGENTLGGEVDEFDEILEKIASSEIEEEIPEEAESDPTLDDKLKEMTDNWQRERASFQNYKRRVEEEKSYIRKYAAFDLAQDLLRVLDYFESSVSYSENLPEEAQNVLIGVKYTIEELTRVLSRHDIVPIDAEEGQSYDPETMEAVERRVRDDVGHGTIIEVKRKGWRFHDRMLRASQVVVAVGKEKAQTESD